MPMVKLDLEDIEPLARALDDCVRHGYGCFCYKGEIWDWRMGKYALEDLMARRDGEAEGEFDDYEL